MSRIRLGLFEFWFSKFSPRSAALGLPEVGKMISISPAIFVSKLNSSEMLIEY